MTGPHIGLRCDAGPTIGVGHLMRCIALAEELTARGARVHFLSDLGGLPWAGRQLADRHLPCHRAPADPHDLVSAVRRLRLDAVVLDSYRLTPAYGAAVRAEQRVVLAIVDGELHGQHADVYLDQNLDAELTSPALPPGAVRLAGLRYSLLRAAVRRHRPDRPRPARETATPRVVCFFGGTDPYRAAPVVTRILLATGAPVDAVVVAATAAIRAELHTARPAPGQRLTVLDPSDDLPDLLAGADLVVSASGTSAWELLCLGLPAALLWVVDNQWSGYRRLVEHGLVAGLGELRRLTDGSPAAHGATALLRSLALDADRRGALGRRAWEAVDGLGPARVADELLHRIATSAAAPCLR